MTCFWDGYQSFPRIASVQVAGEYSRERSGEVLYISPSRMAFVSDGYGKNLSGDSPFCRMRTDDIIMIDKRGIVDCVFSAEENDAVVFITGHCNSNCIMCPSSDQERRISDGMSETEIGQYITLLPETLKHMAVTGGEPTLYPKKFFYAMKQIADHFSKVETLLLTNGRAFASLKMVQRLTAVCPQHLRIAIPLHGSHQELHDSITQTPGSFVQTISGIRNLLAEGLNIEIRIVVSKKNCSDLTHIAEYIAGSFPKVSVVNFIGLETRGNCAKNFKSVYVSHKESAQAIIPAVQILSSAGIDIALYNFPLCAVDRRYWSICKCSITPEKIRYAVACNRCDAQPYCGGFFHTTLSMAKPQVVPINFSFK